jgi:FAD/FMN-containing dehydrogenase
MAQSKISDKHQKAFAQILPPSAVIDPSSALYGGETRCWAFQRDLHPTLVLRPESVEQLQSTIKYLYGSDLNFAIRSGGMGGSSSRSVILSLSAFNDFAYDDHNKTVIIGVGQDWDTVGAKLEEVAPNYAVVGARTGFVGVGGYMLHGGIGWLSHEFGLGSDPQNMLDAHVVLPDGRAMWASEDPDLLWALRGGGGNFAAVTKFKVRCHPYPTEIYSGMIMVPLEQIEEIAKRVSAFARRLEDPKMAMHVFLGDFAGSAAQGKPATPSIMFLVYDAHGEMHGRSEAGFKWALEIEGAIDASSAMTLQRVLNTQSKSYDLNFRILLTFI